jgi:hypothetical protein
MNDQFSKGRVIPPKSKRQWQVYQQLLVYAKELNRLPDARQVSRDRKTCAPQDMLPLIF